MDFKSSHIFGLRDTDSVVQLKQKLSTSKRICVVGNGGIATELVYELKNIDIVWIIRHKYISSTFIDGAAAEFLLDSIEEDSEKKKKNPAQMLRYTVTTATNSNKNDIIGCALGPNWHNSLELCGAVEGKKKHITVEYESEIESISDEKPAENHDNWAVYLKLKNGKTIGCDFVVSATGVSPIVPVLMVKHCFLCLNSL